VRWIAILISMACGFAPCMVGAEFVPVAPLAGVSCLARGEAVIANTGNVFSIVGSLVDSYHSALGAYGGSNVSNHGTVQAAGTIIRVGGTIHGNTIEHSAAGLTVVPVPANAIPLPLGSAAPGLLAIHHQHESITLRPGNYVAADIDLDFPGAINVLPSGLVSIFVTGRLSIGGNVNLHGSPANLQFIVTSSREVHVGPEARL
jgi:hypothetical protein